MVTGGGSDITKMKIEGWGPFVVDTAFVLSVHTTYPMHEHANAEAKDGGRVQHCAAGTTRTWTCVPERSQPRKGGLIACATVTRTCWTSRPECRNVVSLEGEGNGGA